MLNIEERQNGNTTILDLEGDVIISGGSARLRQTISEPIKNDKTKILLNFQKVRYIYSSRTDEVVATVEAFNKTDGTLKLSKLTAKVEEVLSLRSLLPILDIYDDEVSA